MTLTNKARGEGELFGGTSPCMSPSHSSLSTAEDHTRAVPSARIAGELVGELALFHGGTRQASLVASADGFLAAFQVAISHDLS